MVAIKKIPVAILPNCSPACLVGMYAIPTASALKSPLASARAADRRPPSLARIFLTKFSAIEADSTTSQTLTSEDLEVVKHPSNWREGKADDALEGLKASVRSFIETLGKDGQSVRPVTHQGVAGFVIVDGIKFKTLLNEVKYSLVLSVFFLLLHVLNTTTYVSYAWIHARLACMPVARKQTCIV